jgi:chromosome segregation ATPase
MEPQTLGQIDPSAVRELLDEWSRDKDVMTDMQQLDKARVILAKIFEIIVERDELISHSIEELTRVPQARQVLRLLDIAIAKGPDMESVISHVKGLLARLLDEVANLNGRLEAEKLEKQKIQTSIDHLTGGITQMRDLQQPAAARLSRLATNLDDLKPHLDIYRSLNISIAKQLDSEIKEVASSLTSIDKTARELADLSAENTELRDQNKTLNDNLDQLRTQYAELSNVNAKLEEKNKELSDENKVLMDSLAFTNTEREVFLQTFEEYTAEKKSTRAQNDTPGKEET